MDHKAKVFIAEFWREEQKKGLHTEVCADFHEFWSKDKKKVFISKTVRICTNFGVKPQKKKKVCITKSAKKLFLHTNSGVITSILEVSSLEMHSSGTELVTFFGAQSSLGVHNFRLGGASSELGKHGPVMPPGAPGLVRPILRLTGKINECLAKTFFFVFNLKLPGKV